MDNTSSTLQVTCPVEKVNSDSQVLNSVILQVTKDSASKGTLDHVVRGRQHSAQCCMQAAPQSQRWSLSPLDLDSDKFRFFNQPNSAVQLPNFRLIGRGTLRYAFYL